MSGVRNLELILLKRVTRYAIRDPLEALNPKNLDNPLPNKGENPECFLFYLNFDPKNDPLPVWC
jgi:hypothetical protein